MKAKKPGKTRDCHHPDITETKQFLEYAERVKTAFQIIFDDVSVEPTYARGRNLVKVRFEFRGELYPFFVWESRQLTEEAHFRKCVFEAVANYYSDAILNANFEGGKDAKNKMEQ